jgi:hypothetical protein
MKMIHEIRRQRAWEAHKNPSPLPIILGAVIAFGIGLLGVSGVVRVPTVLQAKAHKAADTARNPDVGAIRLGSADAAPLLKVCVPFAKTGDGQDGGRGEAYRALQSASSMSRVAALAGIKHKEIDDTQFAAIWGEIADCVYRQSGWMLCDPDNRALAVEAAGTFIRQLATADKAEKFVEGRNIGQHGPNGEPRAYALQNAAAVKGRVLSGVRSQVAEGRLTVSDFGMLVPSEITQIIRETKVSRNACDARN